MMAVAMIENDYGQHRTVANGCRHQIDRIQWQKAETISTSIPSHIHYTFLAKNNGRTAIGIVFGILLYYAHLGHYCKYIRSGAMRNFNFI